MGMDMRYKKEPSKEPGMLMAQFKQHFCFMWKREFGNMPTEWIIKDYLKSLMEKYSVRFSSNPDDDVSEFTIQYIEEYMPKKD